MTIEQFKEAVFKEVATRVKALEIKKGGYFKLTYKKAYQIFEASIKKLYGLDSYTTNETWSGSRYITFLQELEDADEWDDIVFRFSDHTPSWEAQQTHGQIFEFSDSHTYSDNFLKYELI